MCNFFQKSKSSNIDKSVLDNRIRIRFPFEISFWISLSGWKLTILPDIQPANWIVIISDALKCAQDACRVHTALGYGLVMVWFNHAFL